MFLVQTELLLREVLMLPIADVEVTDVAEVAEEEIDL